MASKCKHQTIETIGEPRGYTSCVAVHPYTDCVPASHGAVTLTEECQQCGSRRRVNSNGRRQEVGTWGPSREHRRAAADRLHAAARRIYGETRHLRLYAHDDAGNQLRIAIDEDGSIIAAGGPHTDTDVIALVRQRPEILTAAQRLQDAVRAARAADAAV